MFTFAKYVTVKTMCYLKQYCRNCYRSYICKIANTFQTGLVKNFKMPYLKSLMVYFQKYSNKYQLIYGMNLQVNHHL